MDLSDRLNHLFGTEEYVKLRRSMVFLREKLMNSYYSDEFQMNVICSGSLGEGVAYPSSDDDWMTYKPFYRVVNTYREASLTDQLLMVPSEHSPGYCMLLDVNKSYIAKIIHVIDQMSFLSSSLLTLHRLNEGESIHGPCVSQVIGDYDYDRAFCISCSFWPNAANDWILRNPSRKWPSYETIQNIVTNGCHVVPIGDQTSSLCQHEWRISFSLAERALMHSFNHTQFLSYNLLRLCLKRVIEKRCPGVLRSYFMKTTLFYTAEKSPREFWQLCYIETCFRTCLLELYGFVDQGYCPSYFIPEYNMMKRKVNHTNRHLLLEVLRSLHSVGIVEIIHLCGESYFLDRGISLQLCEFTHDVQFMNSLFFALTFHSLNYAVLRLTYDDNDYPAYQLYEILGMLQRCLEGKLSNYFFRRGLILCCQKFINRIWNPLVQNKSTYRLHKMMASLLKIGYNVDVTTGKLTTATYMYLIGRTESALSHVRRLLSEYPPYAMNCTTTCNLIQRSIYMDFMCGRGYTIDYKIRLAHAPDFLLHGETRNAFPLPIRILIPTFETFALQLDPLTYAYFLESLCYIRMKNQALLNKTTRCLVNRLDDLSRNTYRIWSIMCIAIIQFTDGNHQSACRWLGSVFIMKDSLPRVLIKDLSHSILTYIACLLNNRLGSVLC